MLRVYVLRESGILTPLIMRHFLLMLKVRLEFLLKALLRFRSLVVLDQFIFDSGIRGLDGYAHLDVLVLGQF